MEWIEQHGEWVAQGQATDYRIRAIPDSRPHYQLRTGKGSFSGAFPSVEAAKARAAEVEESGGTELP